VCEGESEGLIGVCHMSYVIYRHTDIEEVGLNKVVLVTYGIQHADIQA
jgi:hypothetical protein